MRHSFLATLVTLLCIAPWAHAQTPAAPADSFPIPGTSLIADYLFEDAAFGGQQVYFLAKDSLCYYYRGKGKTLALPVLEAATPADVLPVALSNKLKKAEQALFLLAAYTAWDTIKFNIGMTVLENGLAYRIDNEGTGRAPQAGDKVRVHYKGYLDNGRVFDSSFERNEPIEFILGENRVIQGWEQGIPYFKVGSSGTLRIPPELGYGAQGAGGVIPPGATLFFDIEVLAAAPR